MLFIYVKYIAAIKYSISYIILQYYNYISIIFKRGAEKQGVKKVEKNRSPLERSNARGTTLRKFQK